MRGVNRKEPHVHSLFPISFSPSGLNKRGLFVLSLLALAANALLWFAFAFLVAYAATKGVRAA